MSQSKKIFLMILIVLSLCTLTAIGAYLVVAKYGLLVGDTKQLDCEQLFAKIIRSRVPNFVDEEKISIASATNNQQTYQMTFLSQNRSSLQDVVEQNKGTALQKVMSKQRQGKNITPKKLIWHLDGGTRKLCYTFDFKDGKVIGSRFKGLSSSVIFKDFRYAGKGAFSTLIFVLFMLFIAHHLSKKFLPEVESRQPEKETTFDQFLLVFVIMSAFSVVLGALVAPRGIEVALAFASTVACITFLYLLVLGLTSSRRFATLSVIVIAGNIPILFGFLTLV